MFKETLIQNSPFHGQAIEPINGKVIDIHDFIGKFEVIEEYQDKDTGLDKHKCSNTINVSRIDKATRLFEDNTSNVILREYSEDECGIGAGCWLSSIAMIHWMKDNLHEFKNKRIMEIGAGVALPSLYLAKNKQNLDNIKLYCTDYKQTIGHMLKENQVNNNIEPDDIHYCVLDWNQMDETIGTFDIIIACDCIYKSTSKIFKKTVLKHLKIGGKLLFINPLETSRPGVDQFIYSLAEIGNIEVKHIAVRYNNKYVKPLIFVEFVK